MSEFIALMLKPFVACLVLVGIHSYLGLHVIKRGVIFVDLALAQVAALGATVGFLMGFSLHTTESYFISLFFTIVSAALFSYLKSDYSEVPQEAYIGITYAIASAASILILSSVPEGGEELKALMVGHLLFVDWHEIFKIVIVYSLVGVFHWYFRTQFLALSSNFLTEPGLTSIKKWDFLFYVTFGVVVTSSVEIAGVLLVFSFLIVPAVCGVLLAHTTSMRLVVGWLCGLTTSMTGISLSYFLDLPTGATIVCTFGISLFLSLLLSRFTGKQFRTS